MVFVSHPLFRSHSKRPPLHRVAVERRHSALPTVLRSEAPCPGVWYTNEDGENDKSKVFKKGNKCEGYFITKCTSTQREARFCVWIHTGFCGLCALSRLRSELLKKKRFWPAMQENVHMDFQLDPYNIKPIYIYTTVYCAHGF